MIDNIKKILYAGLGIFALSEDKAKEIIQELIKQGEITAQEGEQLISDLKNKAWDRGKSFEEKIALKIKDYLKISELEERVKKLEDELSKIREKLS
ncbi:MAG: hypothetical protein N2999_03960 [Proteobacteria bacterium]|nr:hypothetical protein [Pseudomonadota bacterium]